MEDQKSTATRNPETIPRDTQDDSSEISLGDQFLAVETLPTSETCNDAPKLEIHHITLDIFRRTEYQVTAEDIIRMRQNENAIRAELEELQRLEAEVDKAILFMRTVRENRTGNVMPKLVKSDTESGNQTEDCHTALALQMEQGSSTDTTNFLSFEEFTDKIATIDFSKGISKKDRKKTEKLEKENEREKKKLIKWQEKNKKKQEQFIAREKIAEEKEKARKEKEFNKKISKEERKEAKKTRKEEGENKPSFGEKIRGLFSCFLCIGRREN